MKQKDTKSGRWILLVVAWLVIAALAAWEMQRTKRYSEAVRERHLQIIRDRDARIDSGGR